VRVTYVHFAYDQTGLLMWLERIDGTLEFEHGCSAATGRAAYGIFPPGQDPFGEAPPVFSGTATLAMKRMPVE
jgi:hypothetical protein